MNCKILTIISILIFITSILIINFIYDTDLFFEVIIFWIVITTTTYLNFSALSDSYQNNNFINKRIMELKK
jgi:hypothetical protein